MTDKRKKRNQKVALVGSATSSMDMAPWDDLSFDIWGLAWRLDLKRCTTYFEMHDLDSSIKRVKMENYPDHLRALKGELYLNREYEEVPNAKGYPIDEVIEYFDGVDKYADGDYFASSIAYMVALAIYREYEEIHLFGIDLLDDSEYAYQRPNTEYLLGVARGKGISVYVPGPGALLKFYYRYGYETPVHAGPITIELLQERVKLYSDKIEAAMSTARTADGAKQEAEQLLDILKHSYRKGKRDD